ncbi:hypothetical protein PR202_gb07030 [Eleusine coracana subsp. coracana]|uniref:Uncharacterized protein n=1 Tax=Eleusine coracana subsp. coracana TaxID=191504 RepID=A0AAV5E8P2_ELECO|nr:hypothetical protein QOZ80_2BG0165230 [Eleusine coracana subsp. coracana]GJN19724.1 hypothetical protein PR202_gb07030 [Eleusine coracana subsp. coracana]
MLFVDHYWDRKAQVPNGSCIESCSFKAGDYSWRICYFPNGASLSNTDHISIFIALCNRLAKPVRARVRFSLLDRKGEPVPGHSLHTDVQEYSAPDDVYGFHKFIRKEDLEASEHLANGRITIRCEVSVEEETPLCGLHDFLLPPTDITFRVHGLPFPSHSCVVAARSPAFAAEIARWGTNTGKCIPINGIPIQVFEAVMHFVYTDALPEMDEEHESMIGEHLLAAADRFELPDLKRICADILSSQINENTVTQMMDLAIRHRCQMLHEFCIEFLEDHPALDAVMATDDDGSLLEHVAKSCPGLLKDVCADWFEDDSIQNDMAMCA